jgi:transcriptional regulator with XRE-family HTH domain
MKSKSQFGKYLAKRRKAVGLTTEALAEKVGTSRSAIHYWETGKWLPSVSQLEPLAQALKVSYEDLFEKAGHDPDVLPEPKPYFRLKFPGASDRKLRELARLTEQVEASERRKKGQRG